MKERKEQLEAVIFDLDGTLVDSMWIWDEIDLAYLGRYGIAPPADLQETVDGMSFSETAAYFKERFSLPDSVSRIKEDWNKMAYEKYRQDVPLKKGVSRFLELCKKSGIRMGIASSNSIELVDNVIRARGIREYFSVVRTACDVGKGKPAPDIYLSVADALGTAPSGCLVFEDVIPGIIAGKTAGMRVCAVDDGYTADKRREKQELADYFIEDYSQLSPDFFFDSGESTWRVL